MFIFVLFIAGQADLIDEEELDELLEDEILLYFDEEDEDLLDDEYERS